MMCRICGEPAASASVSRALPGVAAHPPELAAVVHGHRPALGVSGTLGHGQLCWCSVQVEQGSSSPVSIYRCSQGNWFGMNLCPYCQLIPCTDSS